MTTELPETRNITRLPKKDRTESSASLMNLSGCQLRNYLEQQKTVTVEESI